MANIVVTGLPDDITLPRFLFTLKKLLKQQSFWVQDLVDSRDAYTRESTITFDDVESAARAQKFLDNFLYRYQNEEYPLRAYLKRKRRRPLPGSSRKRLRSPSPPHRDTWERESHHDSWERESHHDRSNSKNRDRSRSPLYSECSKLDLEIELLRKRRMIIEEERRLILERKKLQLAREFRPTATKEFNEFQYSKNFYKKEQFHSAERRDYRSNKLRHSSPQRHMSRSFERNMLTSVNTLLPKFTAFTKIILRELENLIKEHSSNAKEQQLLLMLLRATIRKRIAIILEGKDFIPREEIILLYREAHPVCTDEELVKELVENIKESYYYNTDQDGDENKKWTAKENREINEDLDAVSDTSHDIASMQQDHKNDSESEAYIKNEYALSNEDHAAIDNYVDLKNEYAPSNDSTTNEDEAAIDQSVDLKNECVDSTHKSKANEDQEAIDKNVDLKNECALSLDVTDIELALNTMDDWSELLDND